MHHCPKLLVTKWVLYHLQKKLASGLKMRKHCHLVGVYYLLKITTHFKLSWINTALMKFVMFRGSVCSLK